MELLFNLGFAWIAVILSVILAIVYFTRKLSRGNSKFADLFKTINARLRKRHKEIGILLVLTGLLHGILSTKSVFSFNIGTVSWIVSILLGVNFMLRKPLSKYRGWMYYHRILTVVFLLTILIHVKEVGGIQIQYAVQNYLTSGKEYTVDSKSVGEIASGFDGVTFKDGVYTGEATGFRPGLKVSVTVSNNKITDIKVTSHNEVNPRFYQRPIDTVPKEIIDSQSLDVDTVTGATKTSVGIINAVNNALSNAVVSGTLPQTKQQPTVGEHGGTGGDRFRGDVPDNNGSGFFPEKRPSGRQ